MSNIMLMRTISMNIADGRKDLCRLVEEVNQGTEVILTVHGRPRAKLVALPTGKPWRVDKADDLKGYGDLQTPVLEDWT